MYPNIINPNKKSECEGFFYESIWDYFCPTTPVRIYSELGWYLFASEDINSVDGDR